MRNIDTAIAVLMLRGHFSSPSIDGVVRHWDRGQVLARVRRRDVVVVRSLSGRRWWLRAVNDIRNQPTFAAGLAYETLSPRLARWAPDSIREAIRSWYRAVDDQDPVRSIGALWEAIEFYVAKAKVAGLFTPAERRAVVAQATAGLADDKKQRVESVLEKLNEPSLALKLRAAMHNDSVPHTEAEFEFLLKIRGLRNDQVHGRARVPPSEEDLQRATALVNRLLVHRLERLSRARGDQVPWADAP